MRLFFGIILGVLITIGGAYVHDLNAGTTSATEKMVNWEVVSARWSSLTGQVRQMSSQVQNKFSETTAR
jgi:hypothetical protein